MAENVPNPPAFPIETYLANGIMQAEGLSMRDWFAGQSILVAGALCQNRKDPNAEEVAQQAYALADAMLKARTTT